MDQFGVTGFFGPLRCYNADGSLAWTDWFPNTMTNVGINHMLDTEWVGGTQVATWYIGLISNTSFTSISASDTMSSHSGWVEDTTYSESVRQTWGAGSAASQQITNASTVDFSINGTTTIKGAFLTSDNTKGGTTGTLSSLGTFSSNRALVSGQTLNITHTKTGANG